MSHDDWVIKQNNEVSMGGVPGVSTPLGTDSSGTVPSRKRQQDRIKAANIWK